MNDAQASGQAIAMSSDAKFIAAQLTSAQRDRGSSSAQMAFAHLVRSHQRMVYSLALRMLGDRHRAEDLAQDVFLQLHRNLEDIESAAHLGFWLRRVTAHRAIDTLRQLPKLQAAQLDETLEAETAQADPLLQRELQRSIEELPAPARAVVVLRYQEDLDPTEIASTLNMPINTVKSHLKRSLTKLREYMLQRRDAPLDALPDSSAASVELP